MIDRREGASLEEWTEFCGVEEVRSRGRVVRWIGKSEICALGRGEEIVVFISICPHAGGPLGEAKLIRGEGGEAQLQCGWHGYRYRLADGGCEDHPALRMVLLPSKVTDDRVWVRMNGGQKT